jgi:rhodanese-related sulfurtransferase
MKNRIGFIYISLLLSALISLSAIFSGCAGGAGKTSATSPTSPRWVWSAGDGDYSIIVDRQTLEPIRDVTPEEAFGIMSSSQQGDNPVVIDVRTSQEYTDGYISGAVNTDYLSPSFNDDIAELNKDKLYIVYCRTGARSAAARDVMEELGFEHVINMTGGYMAWVAAGLPVNQ